jgi:hydrogenase maturation factor HypF (carbamoyltransferase family)
LANKLGIIDSEVRELLLSPQRPIVLVPKRSGAMSELVDGLLKGLDKGELADSYDYKYVVFFG